MIDPIKQYKRHLGFALLIALIGIGQLTFVIVGRSWLVWNDQGSQGSDIVSIPQSYLWPNRYLIIAEARFPIFGMDDTVGNISLTNIATGKDYFLPYTIVGYWVTDGTKSAVFYISLQPGTYNVTWHNNNYRIKYWITTHGVFNWWAGDDHYPFTSETVALVISILLAVFFIGYAIIHYRKAKLDLAYYK
jgi:hypothetical protein